jgi:hypothetical protein
MSLQNNNVRQSEAEYLEAEEDFMRHCREYCETHPDSSVPFDIRVMQLWNSTRERLGFMAYREEKSILFINHYLINLFVIERFLEQQRLESVQYWAKRGLGAGQDDAAHCTKGPICSCSLYWAAKREQDWEYEAAHCVNGPDCHCHALKPHFY